MAGIGGVETCRRIKNVPAMRDIPLIILTATEQRDAVIEGLGAGADDFVSKASGFDVLSARVQAQIRRKQIEDEQRKVREQLLRSELEAAEARAARELAETRAAMAEELGRDERRARAGQPRARGVQLLGLARSARAAAHDQRVHARARRGARRARSASGRAITSGACSRRRRGCRT